jgi:hypothetical protein
LHPGFAAPDEAIRARHRQLNPLAVHIWGDHCEM